MAKAKHDAVILQIGYGIEVEVSEAEAMAVLKALRGKTELDRNLDYKHGDHDVPRWYRSAKKVEITILTESIGDRPKVTPRRLPPPTDGAETFALKAKP